MTDNPRQLKGREIADRYRIARQGRLWLVPSQSGKGKYKVDLEKRQCNCPDFDFRRQPCKHLYAVEITVERERKTVTETKADGSIKTTVTESVKVTRKTYPQVWPAYNAAQTQEKAQFRYLLRKLCDGIGEPAQTNGRPRLCLFSILRTTRAASLANTFYLDLG